MSNDLQIDARLSGSASCGALRHRVIRNLTALIVPYVTIHCECQTCGKSWWESYKRIETPNDRGQAQPRKPRT